MTYVQHGRRHAPNGTDPIPGSSALAFASLISFGGGGISIAADNAWHYLDLNDGGATAIFDTSDPAIFGNDISAFSGTPYGLSIKQPGTYAMFFNGFYTGGTAAAIGEIYHDDQSPGSGFISSLQFGRTSMKFGDLFDPSGGDHLSFMELEGFKTTADVPAIIVGKAKVQSGGAATLNFQLLVVQLNQFGSDAL